MQTHKKIYGIIGHPVKHSLSPAMQNAAFKELGIDAEYLLYDVGSDALEDFLNGAAAKHIAGLNVTIPHKIKAKEYLERSGSLDETARRLGAVNTISLDESGSLRGFNTDGPGFYRSLVEDLKFEPEGRPVFVLGAGGAAKAVVMYLGVGPSRISVFDIDRDKAAGLKDHYTRYFDGKKLNVITDEKDVRDALDKSDLLINASPIGMRDTDPSPVGKDLFHTGLRVYDLVYNRPVTQLVKEANSMKLHAVNGLGMLLYQGAIAFEIWTGRKAPLAAMKRALREAIKAGH